MSGHMKRKRPRLVDLKEQLTCKICGGYFVDATTIIECLHTFCKSCIVKHLKTGKNCPVCLTLIHKSKPLLNIKPDQIIQDIVYKLVPGCYHNEMQCRKEFYAKHPEAKNSITSPEARGELIESYIFSPDESLSLSLEYYSPETKEEPENVKETTKNLPKRYFRCPAAVTVFHLQKLLRAKHGLSESHPIDILYKEEPLSENYTLMDVMYIYHWKRKVPLHLSYRIFESSTKRIKLSDNNDEFKKSLEDSNIELESKHEKSMNSEWKEVQLKISETGVMSVMDISNLDTNKSTKTDDSSKKSEENKTSQSSKKIHMKTEEKEQIKSNSGKGRKSLQEKRNEKNQTEKSNKVLKNIKTKGNNVESLQLKDNKSLKKTSEKTENKSTPENKSKISDKIVSNQVKVQQSQVEDLSEQMHKQVDDIKICNNSKLNDNSESKAEINVKLNSKSNEMKSLGAGAKINALSAKLQFQPKNNQINTDCSKKSLNDKQKAGTSSNSITEVKTSKIDSKLSEASPERNTENRLNSPFLKSESTTPSNSQKITSAVGCSSDNTLKPKSGDKKKALTADQQLRALPGMPHIGRDIICSTTAASLPGITSGRFSIQTPSMSIYSITPSSKNNTSVNQTMAMTSAKNSLEVTSIYSLPPTAPCPDAIPISLLKGGRKEPLSKGTNLNEICAKISNTSSSSGSKINDICAKIGESSKEKCRIEAQRTKSEVPELLKIPDQCIESSTTTSKHIPNIPNVPIYTPSNCHHGMLLNEMKDKRPITSSVSSAQISMLAAQNQKMAQKKHSQAIGYKTLRDPPKSWNPTLSKNNYVAAKIQAKELQNQLHYGLADSDSSQRQIPSKPAKIFKIKNMPRYLGNPSSGVKPMYGISNDQPLLKEKDASTQQQQQSQSPQQTTSSLKNSTSMSMMKIDPQTLSPIVSSSNSPIVSPPPYSPSAARTYPTSNPFGRNSGSTNVTRANSPRNSPVNMLSTNPFISTHPLTANPRLIYSHFPPSFNEHQQRLSSNPLIRSPIGMPPPSAFHSSLPPAINKLYQRSAGFIGHQNQTSHSAAAAAAVLTQASLAAAAAAAAAIRTSNSGSSSPSPSAKTTSAAAQSIVNSVAFALAKGLAHHDLAAFDFSRVDGTPTKKSPGRPKSGPKLEDVKSSENESSVSAKEHSKTETLKLNGSITLSSDEAKDGMSSPEGENRPTSSKSKTPSPAKNVESLVDKGSNVEIKVQNSTQLKQDHKALDSEKTAAVKKIGNETHKTTIES